VEIALIRDFAKSLEATPSWFWGSEQMHMEALKHFELDVVISGLDSNTPWSKQVGLTNPYYDEEIAVGAPLGAEAPGALRKVRIAVAEGNAAAAYLEKKGAIPVRTASLFETPGPVAAPVWELEKRGFRTTKFVLYEKKHVVAVPPGENGWLKTLGDYLEKHKQEVAMLLRREAQP
jgi:hypothetical protein